MRLAKAQQLNSEAEGAALLTLWASSWSHEGWKRLASLADFAARRGLTLSRRRLESAHGGEVAEVSIPAGRRLATQRRGGWWCQQPYSHHHLIEGGAAGDWVASPHGPLVLLTPQPAGAYIFEDSYEAAGDLDDKCSLVVARAVIG